MSTSVSRNPSEMHNPASTPFLMIDPSSTPFLIGIVRCLADYGCTVRIKATFCPRGTDVRQIMGWGQRCSAKKCASSNGCDGSLGRSIRLLQHMPGSHVPRARARQSHLVLPPVSLGMHPEVSPRFSWQFCWYHSMPLGRLCLDRCDDNAPHRTGG